MTRLKHAAGLHHRLRLAPKPPEPSSPQDSSEPPLDDDALIKAIQRGDLARAGELHDRLIPVVERTLVRIFGRREPDHDDLVQTTFEQIVRTLVNKRFAQACNLSTWASTLAAHVAFHALRSRRLYQRVFDSGGLDGHVHEHPAPTDAEGEIAAREQIRTAQAHLAAMNPDKAMPVILHDLFGHELAEIAVLLNISVSAAQSRLLRGRREFLRRMQRTAPDGGEDDLGR